MSLNENGRFQPPYIVGSFTLFISDTLLVDTSIQLRVNCGLGTANFYHGTCIRFYQACDLGIQ